MDSNNSLAAFQPSSVPAGQQPAQPPAQPRRIAENVYMTNFDDESVKKYEFDLFSGNANETYHLQILLPGPTPLGKGRSHFHDKLKGGGILCRSQYDLSPDGKQEVLVKQANCCVWLGNSAPRFAALIVQYGTTANGQLAKPFTYALKVWRFGVDKYKTLQALHRNTPLHLHDLMVTCTEKQYQKMIINVRPDTALLQRADFPKDHKQLIENWANSSVGKLQNEIGRKFDNDAQLAAHLQQAGILLQQGVPGTPATPTMVPADQPVTSFEDIIGQVVDRQ